MKPFVIPLLGVLLGMAACAAPPHDPVFPDVAALYSTPVDAQVLKSTEADGIVTEEVTFHVAMDGEQRVDTFGYFLYPKGAQGLPAVIWNQSGLAPADTTLAKYGVQRGYAMLCFDYPNQGDAYRSTVKYPINSTLLLTDDVRQAPIAHAAVAALKAVTFLQSRPEVDQNRIGMCGNSWGGFFSTLMAGLDPRLKACASSSGTGSLQLGCSWFHGVPDAATAERWAATLDPGWRLAFAKTPMLWVSSTNDNFYWMPALMRSYALAAGDKHLSIAPNLDHAAPNSFSQQFDWLDIYLQGKTPFLTVTPITLSQSRRQVTARWSFSGPPERTAASASLALSYGAPGNWRSRAWRVLPAQIAGATCSVTLPKSPLPYYIYASVIDNDGFRHSTPLVYIDPKAYGLLDRAAKMPIDGCAEWGGFEQRQLNWLRDQGYPAPQGVPSDKEGEQAALLPAGATTPFMRPYFIAGLTHRLTCYVKAEKPTTVTLRLSGQFDTSERISADTFAVGADWTPVTMDFPTLPAMWTNIQLTATVPPGTPVLLDALSFRPVQ